MYQATYYESKKPALAGTLCIVAVYGGEHAGWAAAPMPMSPFAIHIYLYVGVP